MPINRNIEYKPPGATEWQRIEVVVHPNHREVWAMDAASSASERERMRMRQEEAARQAGIKVAFSLNDRRADISNYSVVERFNGRNAGFVVAGALSRQNL